MNIPACNGFGLLQYASARWTALPTSEYLFRNPQIMIANGFLAPSPAEFWVPSRSPPIGMPSFCARTICSRPIIQVIAKLRRMMFGTKSERVTGKIEQLELKLEELETGKAERVSATTNT